MNYPVTTPFGQVAGYPLNNGFHNGIDYGFPMGTPVIVNGVTIGISNNTGASTGPHLHVGKFAGGVVQNPGVGNGFQFTSAVVFDTAEDATNGKYVRITGDGALWNYLHLGQVLVTKGQVLKGEAMINQEMLKRIYNAFLGRDPQGQDSGWLGKPVLDLLETLDGSEERKEFLANHPLASDAAQKLAQIKQIVG